MRLSHAFCLVLSYLGILIYCAEGVFEVACIGDSITTGEYSSDPDSTSYPAVLQSLLGEDAFHVRNFGMKGATVLKNGDNPYWGSAVFEELVKSNPDIVVVMLGTFDAKHNNWEQHHSEFETDYLEFLDVLRELSPSARPHIHLVIPPPLYQDGVYDMNQTVINAKLPFLIKTISISEDLGIPIDAFSALGGPSLSHPEYIVDGCHPNDRGYFVLAQEVAKNIQRDFLFRHISKE